MKISAIAIALVLTACSPQHAKLVQLNVLRNGQLQLSGEPPFAESQLPSRLEAFRKENPKPNFDVRSGEDGVPPADLDRVANIIAKSGFKAGILTWHNLRSNRTPKIRD